MGQFSDMLDKINLVEAQGFDPYTESYSARIGKLPTTTDPTSTTQPKSYTAQDISKSFTEGGLEDPLQSIVDDTGGVNFSTLSTGFDQAKELGIPQDDYLRIIQETNPEAFDRTYKNQRLITTQSGGIGFESKDKPVQKSTTYRFSESPSQGQKTWGQPVYQRYDEKTGEHITYDTKEAYDNAILEYEKLTGNKDKDKK